MVRKWDPLTHHYHVRYDLAFFVTSNKILVCVRYLYCVRIISIILNEQLYVSRFSSSVDVIGHFLLLAIKYFVRVWYLYCFRIILKISKDFIIRIVYFVSVMLFDFFSLLAIKYAYFVFVLGLNILNSIKYCIVCIMFCSTCV